jgi:hypothetical protein
VHQVVPFLSPEQADALFGIFDDDGNGSVTIGAPPAAQARARARAVRLRRYSFYAPLSPVPSVSAAIGLRLLSLAERCESARTAYGRSVPTV